MRQPTAIEVAQEFWRLMATNDFHSVCAVLSSEFVLEWPQTKERIRGAERLAHEPRVPREWSLVLHGQPARRWRIGGSLGRKVTDGMRTDRGSPSSRSPKAKLPAWSSFGRRHLLLPRNP